MTADLTRPKSYQYGVDHLPVSIADDETALRAMFAHEHGIPYDRQGEVTTRVLTHKVPDWFGDPGEATVIRMLVAEVTVYPPSPEERP